MSLLEPGQSIRGTYEVERLLGEGAFAEVYRVRHRFLGRQAMKVLKRTGMTVREIEDMLGEAVLLSQIGHPNIVRVFDANTLETSQGVFGYFTMENVPGGSLDQFWRSHGSELVPLEASLDLVRQVCRGMTLAHGSNPPVVHRDIKPQNILVGYEASGLRARVSDFGLAKTVNPLTLLATAAGTLAFKPPETFAKRHSDSCAADVWAIGVVFYLLLTDQLPYKVDHELGWSKVLPDEGSVIPPSAWHPQADKYLDEIVLRCLAISPSDRYLNARELLHALDGWKKVPDAPAPRPAKYLPPEMSKSVLGYHSPADIAEAETRAAQALSRSREGNLGEAADLMEEAFNKAPHLRDRYESRVRLWRNGISM